MRAISRRTYAIDWYCLAAGSHIAFADQIAPARVPLIPVEARPVLAASSFAFMLTTYLSYNKCGLDR